MKKRDLPAGIETLAELDACDRAVGPDGSLGYALDHHVERLIRMIALAGIAAETFARITFLLPCAFQGFQKPAEA